MTILRGLPLDKKTQIGFYGTPQEVLQQLREQEEGYLLSRRWLWEKYQTLQNHLVRIGTHNTKRNRLFCHYEKQNAEAMNNSVLQKLDRE